MFLKEALLLLAGLAAGSFSLFFGALPGVGKGGRAEQRGQPSLCGGKSASGAEKKRRKAKKHCLPALPVLCNATGLRLCLAPTTARPTTGCVACGAAKNKNHLTFLVA